MDGKVLRISKTYAFLDMAGNTLCRIKERLLTIKDTMEIEDAEGQEMAVIRKALISPLRDRWNVKVRNGPVATVSKKWFRLTDTYGVEIADNQNDILILATVVAMDAMTHERGLGCIKQPVKVQRITFPRK